MQDVWAFGFEPPDRVRLANASHQVFIKTKAAEEVLAVVTTPHIFEPTAATSTL
jgi:hypothetical protein